MRISDLSSDVCSSDLVFSSIVVEAIKLVQALDPLAKVLGAFLSTIGNIGGLGAAFAELDKLASPEVVAFVEGDRKSVVWGTSVSGCVGVGGGGSMKQKKS